MQPFCPNCFWPMSYVKRPVKYLDFKVDLWAYHCKYCLEYLVGPDQTKDLQIAYEKHKKDKNDQR